MSFYVIPATLAVCAIVLMALFICVLITYLKRKNTQTVTYFLNGKKIKKFSYDSLTDLKRPNLPEQPTWYINKEMTEIFDQNRISSPKFNLYGFVETKKEEPKQEKKEPSKESAQPLPKQAPNTMPKPFVPIKPQIKPAENNTQVQTETTKPATTPPKPPVKPPIPPKRP